MKGYLSLGLATSLVASGTSAQSASSVGISSSAAAATVTSPSAAPPLFPGESVQLTDDVLTKATTALNNETLSRTFSFGVSNTTSVNGTRGHVCKVMPGDAAWPTESTWEVFDQLLGGSLIKPVPLAAYCYPDWPEYDVEKCSEVVSDWLDSYLQEVDHYDDPTSIMLPLYEGRSCMPTGYNYTSTCTQGAYPTYVVNVSTVAEIQLAVNFARNQNLRLVVKNTGHDFNGKSSGKGALSIWTHWFKDKAFYPVFKADNGYSGPAMKLGTGIQAWEAYEFAKVSNVTVIGGEGATVGVAGGYTFGGGHSPLSSMYGMAADQVLAMEVVLADGRFVTATSKQNSDIFWMLRGGGGSTIGVVTSLTIKVYPKLPTTTVTFNWTISDTPNADAFWASFRSYLDNLEAFVDAGTYGYYYLGASSLEMGTAYAGDTDYYFRMDLNVSYTPWYNHADNFHDVWKVAFPLEAGGSDVVKTDSRLLPRKVFRSQDLRHRNFLAQKDAIEKGLFIAGFHISGTGIAVEPPTDNAVLPAWRDALPHVIVGSEWNFTSSWGTVHNSSLFVTNWMNALREISPDSGAYMSEADLLEPNLQEAFYGANYPRLYELKQKYDPTGLFFALTVVGAEDWEVQVTDPLPYSWNNNGRLCPKSS
ncbi:FAD-binding domain-containing protein [Aspergillus sclerotioniger CBS 115572]|uniref:FAD-binding domain-containing protein n=1 Tax=Aspergillus sclerotioniger CBS 115572 TaxID=1450535 RepID=A0A317XFY1_9EURO|nr:FAD-binding domain-containing protein [Aspergillus sclerotioniger CBS 115572]PWY96757.1 FAD-binding domain-containing protein [Aspergillus sclerotioniger CBS 115572]